MHFILRGRREGTNGTFHRNRLGYIGTFDYAIRNANLVPSHFQIRSLTVCSVNETGVFKCHKVTRTGKGMREGVPSNFHLGSLFHNSLVIRPHKTTNFCKKERATALRGWKLCFSIDNNYNHNHKNNDDDDDDDDDNDNNTTKYTSYNVVVIIYYCETNTLTKCFQIISSL